MIQSYTFGLIDGEYILRRNFNMLASEYNDRLINTSELCKMFINSIMKFKREQNVKFCIIAFDKSKYYTACSIEQYKQDRYNATEEKESIEEELKRTDLTEEQRDELLKLLEKAKHDSDNFWKYQDVKKDLLENSQWSRAGFHTVYKRGYEADMIIYYLAYKIEEAHKKDNNINALIYSADKDMVNFQSDGVEFLSSWNNKNKYESLENEYLESLNRYNELYPNAKIKLDMYSYGILNELSGNTHNNASVILPEDKIFNTMSWEEYYYRILNQETKEGFLSYDILRKCYESLNLWYGKTCDNGYCPKSEIGIPYYIDLEPTINKVLSECNKYESGIMFDLLDKHNFKINMVNYAKYISTMKKVENF